MGVAERDHSWIRSVAATQHPALLPWIERVGPIVIGPPRHPTVADQLFVEVVNQQLSAAAGDAIWSRIEAASQGLGVSLRTLFSGNFDGALRSCGLSRFKSRALREIAAAEAQGLLDTDQLLGMPHDERSKRLSAIWGVGQWTADMIGIFHFHDPDIWPEGDVAVVKTFQRIAGVQNTRQESEAYAPRRSLLARYLWRIRDS